MARIPLSDGSGKWFDDTLADRFEETTTWDRNNHISDATGSQWRYKDGQVLFRTASKRWVLHEWSKWEGEIDTYEEITVAEAARWLVCNGHDHPDVAEQIADLEL